MAGHLAAITRIAVLLLALGCAGTAQADEGAIGRGALESELLRFSVTQNPQPMQEWTPWADIHPP